MAAWGRRSGPEVCLSQELVDSLGQCRIAPALRKQRDRGSRIGHDVHRRRAPMLSSALGNATSCRIGHDVHRRRALLLMGSHGRLPQAVAPSSRAASCHSQGTGRGSGSPSACRFATTNSPAVRAATSSSSFAGRAMPSRPQRWSPTPVWNHRYRAPETTVPVTGCATGQVRGVRWKSTRVPCESSSRRRSSKRWLAWDSITSRV